MKIDLKNLRFFILGSLILLPFNYIIFDTQIFFIQTLLIIILLVYLSVHERQIRIRTGRIPIAPDALFYLYFGWVLISFLINFIFSFDDFGIQMRRSFSLGIAVLLMSGFFIGRALKGVEFRTKSLVNGFISVYLLVIVYIVLIFVTQPSLDLYIVRRIIGQRLPFVLAFVSTVATVYFFLKSQKRFYSFLMMISGTLAVIASLTRAAYIQIFVSFVILFIGEIKRYFFRGLLISTFILVTGFVFLKMFGDFSSVKQVTSRVELLFDYKAQSKDDISGSFRLEMWKFLSNKLLSDPIHLVIGFGQLGPTQITKDFVLSDGTIGTSSAHNQYLDIVVREGIIGLILFLWLCYKSIALGFHSNHIPEDAKIFILANSIGLTGVMFYGFFHETFRYPLFGFYFWLYLGMLSRVTEKK